MSNERFTPAQMQQLEDRCSYRIWWIIPICPSDWIHARFRADPAPMTTPMLANSVRYGISWVIVGPVSPYTPRLSRAKRRRWQWQRQEVAYRPAPARQSGGHSRGPLAVSLGLPLATPFPWLPKFHAQ